MDIAIQVRRIVASAIVRIPFWSASAAANCQSAKLPLSNISSLISVRIMVTSLTVSMPSLLTSPDAACGVVSGVVVDGVVVVADVAVVSGVV